jgi:hypothetical protein
MVSTIIGLGIDFIKDPYALARETLGLPPRNRVIEPQEDAHDPT